RPLRPRLPGPGHRRSRPVAAVAVVLGAGC
ncbi:transcriptional regulator, LuxR family, partial [Streptomyces ipomoeae 91-03]